MMRLHGIRKVLKPPCQRRTDTLRGRNQPSVRCDLSAERVLCWAPDVDLTLSGFAEDEIAKVFKNLESREKRERLETADNRPEAVTRAIYAAALAEKETNDGNTDAG